MSNSSGEHSEDLLKALVQNEELKKREARLVQERDVLANKIKMNSVKAADVNKEMLITLNDVSKQRKNNFTESKALEIASDMNEFITSSVNDSKSSYESSLNELNSLTQQLSINDHQNLLECLVKSRLKVAEQEELLNDLTREQKNLERDIQVIRCQESISVNHFQEEYMDYQRQEANVKKEFETVKLGLQELKQEISEQLNKGGSDDENAEDEAFSVRFKFWKPSEQITALKTDVETTIERICDLENEKEIIRQRIDHLQKTIEDLQHASGFRNQLLADLHDKLNSNIKGFDAVSEKITKTCEEFHQQFEFYNNHLSGIRESIQEKDKVVDSMNQIVISLQQQIEDSSKMEPTDSTSVKELEDHITNLEDELKIKRRN